jgi:hypothetical protein
MIIEVLYKDHSENSTPHQVTYKVKILERFMAGVILDNVEDATTRLSGPYNFMEIIRQPVTKLKSGKNPQNFDNISEFGVGDTVLLTFVDGDEERPIIIGALPSRLNKDNAAQQSDGLRILGEYNGLRWNINDYGELIITYQGGKRDIVSGTPARSDTGDTQIKIDNTGSFRIIDNEDQEFKIDRVTKKITIDTTKTKIELDKTNDKTTVTTDGGAEMLIDGTSDIISATTNAGVNLYVDGASDEAILEDSSG